MSARKGQCPKCGIKSGNLHKHMRWCQKQHAEAVAVGGASPHQSPWLGKKNVYRCPRGHETVTLDVASGTTPFLIPCMLCSDWAQSCMYRCDQSLHHTHEWYAPATMAGLSQDEQDHCRRGGLLMRERVFV